MRVVLSIAGSDSVGGAGIQADIKAITSLGLHAACAITAVTSQSSQKIKRIKPLPILEVLAQIKAVVEDADVVAVKTGMLFSGKTATAIAGKLSELDVPIVVDPVMVAGVGDKLHSKDLLDAIKDDVLPVATLVTPNRYEAEAISSMTIDHLDDAEKACRTIAKMGAKAVLLKGGHFEGPEVVDLLYFDGKMYEFASPRLNIQVHGGGCTLASYIAGNLGKGMDMRSAVLDAKRRITDAIALSYPVGQGKNVVNPMASSQKECLRLERVIELTKAVAGLKDVPEELVPDEGMDFVFALPAPQSYSEVCGIDGMIKVVGGEMILGAAKFDASRAMARTIISLSTIDPKCLSGLSLSCSKDDIGAFERAGLIVKEVRNGNGKGRRGSEEGALRALVKQTGFVPDMLFDVGGMGRQPMVRAIGTDPADVVRKVRTILR